MKKLLTFILAIVLLLTTAFSYTPYMVNAESEEPEEPVAEVQQEETENTSDQSETEEREDPIIEVGEGDSENTFEATDEDQMIEGQNAQTGNSATEEDGGSDEGSNLRSAHEIGATMTQNPETGEIIITADDPTVYSRFSDVALYDSDDKIWGFFTRISDYMYWSYCQLKNGADGQYISIPADSWFNENLPNGTYYADIGCYDENNNSYEVYSGNVAINAVTRQQPGVTNIVEINTDTERGIAIYAGSEYLKALISPSSSPTYNEYLSSGNHPVRGGLARVSGNNGIVVYNQDDNSTYLVLKGDHVLVTKRGFLDYYYSNSYNEQVTVKLEVPGYEDVEFELDPLSNSLRSNDMEYRIQQAGSWDLIINAVNSSGLDFLEALELPNVYGAQPETIQSYVELRNFDNTVSMHIENASYDGGAHTYAGSILYDNEYDEIVLPFNNIIDADGSNNPINTGTVFTSMKLYSAEYGTVEYTLEHDGFVFTIRNGMEDTPTDVAVSTNADGDLVISSQNKDFLQALARYNEGRDQSPSMVTIDNSPLPNPISIMNQGYYAGIISYDGTNAVISKDNLIRYNVANGTRSVTVHARRYRSDVSATVTFTQLLNQVPEITISNNNNQIVISSDDTEWISALYNNRTTSSYISMFSENDGYPTYIGGPQGSGDTDEMVLSADGKSITIPENILIRRAVLSDTYKINIVAEGYAPYRCTMLISTSVQALPKNIQVYYQEGSGIIIRSDRSDISNWLEGICNNSTDPKASFIKLKRSAPRYDYGYDYSFSVESAVYENGQVLIPDSLISGYVLQDEYYIIVGSYGYARYIPEEVLIIGDVANIPYDLHLEQGSSDEVKICTSDLTYLYFGLMNKEAQVLFYESGQGGSSQNGSIIATGNAGTGTLKAVFTADDMRLDEDSNCIIIDAAQLVRKGIESGRYEIVLDATYFCNATSALNFAYSKAHVVLDANGGHFIDDESEIKDIAANANSEISLPVSSDVANGSYHLDGWKNSSGNAFAGNYIAASNVVLYALWSKNDNIGSGSERVSALVTYDETASGSNVSNENGSTVLVVNTSTGSVIIPAGETGEVPQPTNVFSAATETELYSVVNVDPDSLTSVQLQVDYLNQQNMASAQQAAVSLAGSEYAMEQAVYLDVEIRKTVMEDGEPNVSTPQPNSPITLSIELPDELMEKLEGCDRVFKIVHVKSDGNAEYLEATLEGRTLTFTTSSLSPFAIVYKDVNPDLSSDHIEYNLVPGGNGYVKPESFAFYYRAPDSSSYVLDSNAARMVFSYQWSEDSSTYDEFGYDIQIDAQKYEAILNGSADGKIVVKYTGSNELHEYPILDMFSESYSEYNSYWIPTGAEEGYHIRYWLVKKQALDYVRIVYNNQTFPVRYDLNENEEHVIWYIREDLETQTAIQSFYNALKADYENTAFSLILSDSQTPVDRAEIQYGTKCGYKGYYYEYDSDNIIFITGLEEAIAEDYSFASADHDDFDFDVYYSEYWNEFSWNFYVDPIDYYLNESCYLDVVISGNNGADVVLVQNNVDYDPNLSYNETDGTWSMTLRKYEYYEFTVSLADDPTQSQTHYFYLNVRMEDVYDYTFLESNESILYSCTLGDVEFSSDHSYVKDMMLRIWTSEDIGDFYDWISDQDPDQNFDGVTEPESEFYSLELKQGTEIVSKKYSQWIEEYGSFACITYVLSREGKTETVRVLLEGPSDGPLYENSYTFYDQQGNEKVFDLYSVEKDGKTYYVYLNSTGGNVTAETFLEYTKYKLNTLVVEYGHTESFNYSGGSEVQRRDLYDKGIEYQKFIEDSIEIYYPSSSFEITNGIYLSQLNHLNNLTQVGFPTDAYIRSIIIYRANHEDAESTLEYCKNDMFFVYDLGGSYYPLTDYKETYEDLVSCSGIELAYNLSITDYSNMSAIVLNVKSSRYGTINAFEELHYSSFYNENQILSQPVEYWGPSGESAVDTFEDLVYSVIENPKSVIKLRTDLELDKDLILSYHRFEGYNHTDDRKDKYSDLLIDLNGHNIIAGNHSIEIPRSSSIHFIDSAYDRSDPTSKPSKIIGTGSDGGYGSGSEPALIRAYGNLFLLDGVLVQNENGIGVNCYEICNQFYLGLYATIDAKTGLKISEKYPGRVYDEYFYNGMTISGTIIGEDYAIYVDRPSSSELSYTSLGNDNWPNDTENPEHLWTRIVSDHVGVYVNGYTDMRMNYVDIEAESPFVINGGRYLFESSSRFTANGEYDSSNQSFTKQDTNGALFLVYSDSANNNLKVDFRSQPNNSEWSASGPIFAATSSVTAEKIKRMEITSTGQETADAYIDFRCNEIAVGIPSGKLRINTGAYANKSMKAYIPVSSMDDIKETSLTDPQDLSQFFESNKDYYIVYPTTHNDKTFYVIRKPNDRITVSSLTELEDALSNPNIQFITLADDTDITGNDAEISFEYYEGKYIDLNGNTLSGVRLVANVTDMITDNSNVNVFRIENGTVENNGVAVISNGAKLELLNVQITSASEEAIRSTNGLLWIHDSVITGKNAIKVDVDSENAENHYIGISIHDSTLTGNNDSAIWIYHTANDAVIDSLLYLGGSGEGSYAGVSNNTSNVSAIKVEDHMRLWISNCIVEGGTYAIEMADSIPDQNDHTSGIEVDDPSVLRAVNGVYLSENSRLLWEGAAIDASNNAIVCKPDTEVVINNGYFKAENGNIISISGSGQSVRFPLVYGGFYSKEIPADFLPETDSSKYAYKCLQVDPIDADHPYPFAVVLEQKLSNATYQNIAMGSRKRNVSIDEDQLDSAISEAERKARGDIDVVLTVREETDGTSISAFSAIEGVEEYYDIHMNKNIGDSKNRVDEVPDYQIISISLDDVRDPNDNNILYQFIDPDRLIVYHKHGESDPVQMKKVSETDALELQEECYYVKEENEEFKLYIVTRRFSTFALAESDGLVDIEPLKENVTLDLSDVFRELYATGSAPSIPATITIGQTQLNVENDVSIVYEGTGDTVYYSEVFPNQPGTYRVVWVINEEVQSLTGRGSKTFTIADNPIILDSKTISMKGDIGIVFCLDIPAAIKDSVYVHMNNKTYPSYGETVAAVSGLTPNPDTGFYEARKNVPIAHGNDEVNITVTDAQGNLLPFVSYYGDDLTAQGYDFSVSKYIEGYRALPAQYQKPNVLNFLNSIENYMNASRIYFNYDVTEGLSVDHTPFTDFDISDYESYEMVCEDSLDGIERKGSTLVLDDATSIRHRFKLTEGSIDDYTFTVSAPGKNQNIQTQLRYESSSDTWLFYIRNVTAKELDRPFTLTITRAGEEGSLVLTYSGLTYAYRSFTGQGTALDDIIMTMCKYNADAQVALGGWE